MKRTLIWISGITLLAICGGWLGLHYLENGYISERISQAALQATGSPIKLKQNPEISLFPPSIKFGQAEWKSPGDPPHIVFSTQGGMAELATDQLLGGKLALKMLSLDQPRLEINPAASGVSASAAGNKQDAPKSEGEAFPPFDLQRLMVHGGAVIAPIANRVARLEKINLSAENLRKRQDMDIICDFVLNLADMSTKPDGENKAAALAGNLAFKGKARYYEPNITFRQASATFTATDDNAAKEFTPLRLSFDGALNLDNWHYSLQSARLDFPQASASLEGGGDIPAASFLGQINLEANIARLARYVGAKHENEKDPANTLILAGPLVAENQRLAIENLAIKLGDGSGTGKLLIAFPTNEKPLGIEGHINMGKVSLRGFSLANGDKPANSAPKQASAGEQRSYPGVNFRVDVAGLDINRLRMANLGFLLHGEDGAYMLDDFTFSIANGGVLASARADLAANEMSLRANGRDVDLGYALNEFGIEGLESGRTAFEAELKATGGDLAALKHSLSGKGQMESRGLKIAALNSITQMLRFFGGKNVDFGDSFTLIKAIFSAENGHVRFSPITASSKALSLEGGALVNLKRDYLDGSAQIKALGLSLPVTFGGPFNDIKFGVSPDAIMNATKNLPESLLRSMEGGKGGKNGGHSGM